MLYLTAYKCSTKKNRFGGMEVSEKMAQWPRAHTTLSEVLSFVSSKQQPVTPDPILSSVFVSTTLICTLCVLTHTTKNKSKSLPKKKRIVVFPIGIEIKALFELYYCLIPDSMS